MRGHLKIAGLLSSAVLLAGCASVLPQPTPEASSACVAETPGASDSAVVTPAELCAIDGQAWSDSVFTTVINTPGWGETSAPCDAARQEAFYGAWQDAQPAVESLELRSDSSEQSHLLGAVGVAVVASGDPAAATALIDAEVAACLVDGSAQSRDDRGVWHGVRGPASGDTGEQLSWWASASGSWVLVQAYEDETLSTADAAALEQGLDTLLDTQAELLGL